ncbi:hydroxymethylglutaryl-CoA lyase [Cribrihabitans marinus]|uniref:Hydroxymethylglutaryl-CoA lyase n=1 Tax=Cribrihabitans marinus TaxID=1227549 RepID=A0A1H7E482_9RHOB|nr:hydroxymethylglutaryl-CoA lyase [Cribrihabitans marinus]GGH41781.1 hydroxymethylglutaryl-CoA lyase [Cribrihabitans marinus]SEK07907.1 hydroxymethylglutaryl-CoA lyase [Cribrihabitans marinus]
MSPASRAYPPDRVVLREVGLRDGLQMVEHFPSTTAKADWLHRESAAGVRHFEVGSFLPAHAMPQFADVRGVIDICRDLGVHAAALALNDRGAADAVQTPLNEIVTVVSATEEHSQANARRSQADAIALVGRTVEMAKGAASPPLVQAGISMAFGCSIAGAVPSDDVVRIAAACVEAGADLLGLADTVGFAGPDQVTDLVTRVQRELGDVVLSIHLHDTRGMGIANASAALDAGVRVIDGSLGGLGGCPFAPGATGNVVFEDLVYLCERKGFATGIDLEQLMSVRDIAATAMPDEPLYGATPRAGAPRQIDWRAS